MIGSCFNQVHDNFEPCAPKPIFWNENNWYRIGECIEFLEWFEPIPLTEKILMEWCGAFSVKPNQYRISDRLIVVRDGKFVDYGSSVELPYLHIFQRFILVITNEPLKIELK
jgi:hypothetical protein